MRSILRSAKSYFSLVKFSHTVFALPFGLIGFSLAVTSEEYSFTWRLLLLIILCMVFARNAAMGFNRVADKSYDALNPRTKAREIPSGIISARSATIFVIINSLLFIAATAFINRLTLFLSPVALIIILGYSLTKRITSLSHFLLGLGLSLAPIGAYISVTNSFAAIPVFYSFIVITWVSGFDIIYSLQDEEFDRDNQLRSIPQATGKKRALIISSLVHLITFTLVIITGLYGNTGILYWVGAALFSGLLFYQHIIVKPGDLSKVNLAFATTNGIASILYAAFVISDLFVIQT